MLVYSSFSSPTPGVNEPHYLGKARHFWDQSWCAADLLMASADTHYVFYWTFGAAAKTLPFWQAATLGRAFGLLLVAIGWVSLGRRLTASRFATGLALGLFLLAQRFGTLSGEWIVGGIEGKVPAWAFTLLAIRFVLDRQWLAFGVNAGLATSFHPVVGAWLVLAVIATETVRTLRGDPPWGTEGFLPLAKGALLASLLAAPGLIPAIAVLRPPSTVPIAVRDEVRDVQHMQERANYIQVFGRLKHHLDPVTFPKSSWILYAGLLAASATMWRWQPFENANRIAPLVAAGCIFALAAATMAYGPRPASEMAGYAWKAQILKLYPFRFIDALLPIVVAFQIGSLLIRGTCDRPRLQATTCIVALCLAPFSPLTTESSDSTADRTDWLSTCEWIATNTDTETLCITPRNAADFKWFAERAEYVNYKDCPQDAVGIVEWNRRLWLIQTWRKACIQKGSYSAADLRRLAKLTGADYLVTSRIQPIVPEPTHRNETYRVYRLRPAQ